jgi:hypothetical protein
MIALELLRNVRTGAILLEICEDEGIEIRS